MSQRERFENSSVAPTLNLSKDSDGQYWMTSTRAARNAWQEAERQTIELLLLAIRTGAQEDEFTGDADHDSGILHGLRIAERIVSELGEEE